MKAVSPGYHPSSNFMQMALMMLHVKKGTQQIKNTAAKKKEITLAGIALKRAKDLHIWKKCNHVVIEFTLGSSKFRCLMTSARRHFIFLGFLLQKRARQTPAF